MTGPDTDVFLSYKAEDRARLIPFVEALEAEGFSVWWDAHIGGGTNWHEDIERHLDAAKCVVVAWSKRSVGRNGDFVREEARRAQKRGAYVPVCIDGVEPPLGFGEIQSLPLKGWKGNRSDPRFQAVLNAVRNHVSGEHVPLSHVHLREPRVTRRGAIAGGVGVATIAAAGVGGWLLFKPGTANAKRIAVLPFANLSGAKDQAYFAEGIAEELRSALSHIGLQVIGRASSEAVKDLDTRAAASRLGVAHILTGSVRRSPQMLRINAQLVGGRDGVEIWAQSYDRVPGDEIKIQTDIATNVAQAMNVALGLAGKAALTLGGTADSGAQDLLLRANALRQGGDAESLRKSIILADGAIARDPRYAEAYRFKGETLLLLSSAHPENSAEMAELLSEAESAARRAMTIAPKLGSAYLLLAGIRLNQLNFPVALQFMRQSLALSPEDAKVLSGASRFMMNFGDPREALKLVDRAITIDPLRAATHLLRGQILAYALRDYPQAIRASQKALELTPENIWPHETIAACLTLMGRNQEAKVELAKMPDGIAHRLYGEAIVAARSRDLVGAERIIAQMRERFGEVASYQYAEFYAQAGDINRAFAELNNAVRIKDPGLTALKIDPFLDPIRRDQRYAGLLKRLNFPSWM